MAAHPLPGKVFIDPTSANVGGTQLVGIEGDEIAWDDGIGTQHFGTGLQSDAWGTTRKASEVPPKLVIPVRDASTTTMQLLFALLSTGGTMHSQGGNSVAIHGRPPSVGLVVRPKDTTFDFLYGPRWMLHADSVKLITWHRNIARFSGSLLALAPSRSLDGSLKAFMEDTVANIDTYYSL